MTPVSHPYRTPSHRPLRVYAFDPSSGRKLNNYMTVKVPYEPLALGPVGNRLAVVDFDSSNQTFYQPVDLDNPAVLVGNGLEPSESDPRFHQQMVYAVASETISRCEYALGRPIRWRTMPGRPRNHPFHARLMLLPHAFQQANAFYDPKLGAVMFGYFPANKDDSGDALPGQVVFTCLSHDIITHEMTHAILDGQREFLKDATGPDAAGFHEAFADIVALFQHFSNREAVLDTIQRTGGLIYKQNLQADAPLSGEGNRPAITAEITVDNPLSGLARQFGQATGKRGALRSAIGTLPNSKALGETTEPHLRGAILVAAVFDAFFTIYIKRTRALMRIARVGGAVSQAGDLHPDLAGLLADEAARVASHFFNICVRAIDYCPPLDLQFGEYLRAVITADSDLVPDDPWDYRAELITAFRLRGIIPDGVRSYSEESLRWLSPEGRGREVEACKGLDYGIGQIADPADEEEARGQRKKRASRNATVLNAFATRNAEALGLDPALPIQPHSYHAIHRVSPTGKLVIDFVVEFLQRRQEPELPDLEGSPLIDYRGGSTVIFDELGKVRYVIEKSIKNPDRPQRQQEFRAQLAALTPGSAYNGSSGNLAEINFQLLHRDQ